MKTRKTNALDYIDISHAYPLDHIRMETRRYNKFMRPYNLRFRLRGRGSRKNINSYSKEMPVLQAPRIAIYLEARNPEGQWSIVQRGDTHIKLTLDMINNANAKMAKKR